MHFIPQNLFFMFKLLKYSLFFLIFLIVNSSCTYDEYFVVKEVVLTFDDAPNFPENTVEILNILKNHQVKATFFCVGESLKNHPDIAYRIANEQYMGNHTYTHIKVGESDIAEIYDYEILQTQNIIDSLQYQYQPYFRPPYGSLTETQKKFLVNKGFKIIMWDMSAEEWNNNVSTKDVINYFHNNLYYSAQIPVILFHLNTSTIEALDILLTEFKEKNISVISLDEYQRR